MSTSHEGDPPNERPSYPGFSGPDEVTQTDLRTPPPRRDTQPITLSDVMAYLGRLDGKLDDLAGKVKAVDRGLIAYNSELNALRADMNTGIDAVRTMLMGNDQRNGIVKDVGLLREQMSGALGAISALPPRLTAIEEKLESVAEASAKSLRVACGSWVQVTTGEVDERERANISAIVVSHSSGG